MVCFDWAFKVLKCRQCPVKERNGDVEGPLSFVLLGAASKGFFFVGKCIEYFISHLQGNHLFFFFFFLTNATPEFKCWIYFNEAYVYRKSSFDLCYSSELF